MTTTVNVHEAKTHLSRLLEQVEAGEEIVIARAGKPCARLVPIRPQPRTFGVLRELADAAADDAVLAPLPDDELVAWES